MSIRRLPVNVANAIAAGEVIERPASVLKELIENSLDANARHISIDIRGSGRNLIRIHDDGDGITKDDMLLAFENQATSKVYNLEDLGNISSLGFRGEALASIAAVSEVFCQSHSFQVKIRASEVLESSIAPPTPGTTIEVRDLFFNTPARLKFLKSDDTERSVSMRLIASYALLYPHVKFDVTLDDKKALSSPGQGGYLTAYAAVNKSIPVTDMVSLEIASPNQKDLSIRGLVSQPTLNRGNRDGIILAVNNRPITSRSFAFALEECYRGVLERGRYPLAVINITIDPSSIDVNVHPTKKEVKFQNEGHIFSLLQQAVRISLVDSPSHQIHLNQPSSMPSFHGSSSHSTHLHPHMKLRDMVMVANPSLGNEEFGFASPPSVPDGAHCQVQRGYIVSESIEGLVLIDQHAAHERILYNKILVERQKGLASQALLIPLIIDLGIESCEVLLSQKEMLSSYGFSLDDFGGGQVRLNALPASLSDKRATEALREISSLIGRPTALGVEHEVTSSLACHSAVRFGDTLSDLEQKNLISDLEIAENSLTCPHGRPTRLVLNWQEVKTHFRRNY